MAVATGAARASEAIDFRSVDEARTVLDETLDLADRDPEAGPILQAIGLRQQLDLTDLGLSLSVRTVEARDHCLEWSFAQVPEFEPLLVLRMSGATVNRFLQGCESAAVGIARGAIEVSGSSRAALSYLPAMRHLARCYTTVVVAAHPHLACSR